ncbi:MAG: HNH endonuclease [bacterium]
MSYIPTHLRRLVIERAVSRCEYCQLSQDGQEATFHIDHIIPKSAGGKTITENLALACVSCSLRKATRQSAVDPQSGKTALLYNPRSDDWYEHFKWDGEYIGGLTATGRATVAVLNLNRILALAIRREEIALGRHPAF